ncbi:unnamed protein product [Calypogeia fissa]
MQFLGLARKFRVSSKSRLVSLHGVFELLTSIHFLSTDNKQCESVGFIKSPIVFPVRDFISTEVGRLTHAWNWKGVIGVEHSAMLTSVSAGISGLSQSWKCPDPILGGKTVGLCIRAPVRTYGFPNRGGFFSAEKTRRTQFCICSSSVVQSTSEVGQSEENEVSKALRPTIYDSLETERITVELFPELDFSLEGNFYPKLVKLVARKINVFLQEEGGEERVPALLQHLGMKLNPHLVAEVMKLQQNPDKADHFFHWAGNQANFQHNSHTYNLKFWNLISKKNVGSGNNNNVVLALTLLQDMLDKGLTPGSLECNVLVDRLSKDKKVGAALKLTRVLERKGFPDIYTYNSLINGLGKAGLLDDIFELLKEMRQKECIPDRVTYNSVINGFSKAGIFKEVFELVDEMTEKGCNPDIVTYNSIIYGLCNARRWEEALKIFGELEGKEIVPDEFTYNSLIFGLFKCGQPVEARNVFDLMGLRGCPPDRITYNILIDGLLNYNEIDEAWKLFHYMEEEGFSPDEVTYNILIGGLVENYRMAEASRVFATMKEKGCKPNAITYKLLGVSDEDERRSVGEKRSSNGRGSNTSGFGEPKMLEEEERRVLHS